MGSAAGLEPNSANDGTKRAKSKPKSVVPKDTKTERTSTKGKKRTTSQKSEEPARSRKMPKRAAACSDFKEKSVRLDDKTSLVEAKKEQIVEEECLAVRLTSGKEDGRPCRRLTDFLLHDSDGLPQPFEMSEVDDIFISGLILPLEDSSEKEKETSVRCEGFGRVETWAISGYEDGTPVIWVSTELADYDCLKPSSSYKKFYDHFYAKASVCIEAYKKLSRSSGGNPDLSLDELLAGVVRAMSGSKCFSGGASIKDFILSQGTFIYNQLVGLDESCKKSDTLFAEMPVLATLRDGSSKHMDFAQAKAVPSNGTLTIGSKRSDGDHTQNVSEEDEDVKLAKLLQEEEYWNSMKQKKGRGPVSSSKFYIKINEDEIANDYPLPEYYKTSTEETDEYVVVDNDMDVCDPEDLPRNMLHDWSLYNSDSRLISLELLPMKPCADIDVTIFGSGLMTADDGSGFCLDSDSNTSSSGSNAADLGGIPIYLSAIKEWMIEFGSDMVLVSVRTDMSWYRLGKPSKQYAPWYEPVLKTARLAINIITLLKEQSRVSRLSFADVIKRVSEFEKDHPSFVSSNPTLVERYVVVHGQIILQQFAEYPDVQIKKCPFVVGLTRKMEERHHTKWIVKKKKVIMQKEQNLNPRAAMTPYVSKRKAMQATTTRLINRIWGEYYSNYSPEEPQEEINGPAKAEEEAEEQEENDENDAEDVTPLVPEKTQTPSPASRRTKSSSKGQEIKWVGDSSGQTSSGESLYRKAIIHGDVIAIGTSVSIEAEETDGNSSVYFVEYMFETGDGTKMFHGRKLQRGSFTVLGNAANERELFLTNECLEFELGEVKEKVTADIRSMPWGYQHRKENAESDKNDRDRAEERKKKGLPIEYYCKSLYCPEKGAFFSLPVKTMGLGSGICHACNETKALSDKERFEVTSKASFVYGGTEYAINDFIYVSPHHFSTEKAESGTFKSGRNVGLKAYVICQLLELHVPKAPKKADPTSTELKVRRFFRPEDISAEKAYCSDIREVYYSEETHLLSCDSIEGRCEVRKKHDLPSRDVPALFEHIFFCECSYNPSKGSLKQLSSDIRLKYSTTKTDNDAISRKKKGKCIEGEGDLVIEKQKEVSEDNSLTTLDIFAGCGGLSEGLQQSGVTNTKWAIEYEQPAGDAFRLNHPESFVFVNNCNVILRAVMENCGDVGDCISTPEAADLASSLGEKEKSNLPMPGQVDFINGGPPCQGFSGMNRFNQGTWSKVQCEMILAFLSFADYFRPKFFLLENVRNFVSFNKGQTFRLTIASLLEMGYQVRFGILEAGTFGVPQSRKRAFIWAAAPGEVLPNWPEPMHVFGVPELKINLSEKFQYAAARSTAGGAPFRSITVRDTIGDLPPVLNGASKTNLEYQNDPISWFQKQIRGNMIVLTDHISKEMNELNLIRCKRIPKRPGADWQDLPDEKVKLSTGQMVDLIPWCLPNTAKRHNQWKGLFGRLDWDGNFPTSVTDPQPMGKVGMCFHPEQDRIVTVRECARSQVFYIRKMGDKPKYRILMVSDFFYPNFGGVENHIYYLSQCLLKLGHKVVVLTHAYGKRSGVRYMTGGLKVYYLPWKPFVMQNTFPTIYGTLPIMRTILVRENISLVHGHQAFSTLCHEALMHARTMGYKVVFTDHSLYGFADAGSIHMNKVLQFTLADVSQAICVSHTSKENTVLRSGIPAEKVYVIPNAVDTAMFKPAPERLRRDEIVIVVISRLVYRKGADLLVEVIPEVCHSNPNVRFIVGGDGPKRVRLEEMREKHSLQDRVEMLGAVPHAKVRSVLISGHIFLNSSLTEAFCIAILEAASCGLLTVSTRVGGVPEVLPEDMVVLAKPDPSDMVKAIQKAILMLPYIDPQDMHLRMKKLYSWHDVAKRTEIVYDRALRCPNQDLLERLSRYLTCGAWAGKLFCLVMLIDFLLWHFLQWFQPTQDIEVVPNISQRHLQAGEKASSSK